MAKKMGRPEIPIKKEDFEKLCYLQCTEEEIAGFYDCSIDTINNWCKKTYGETFSDTYKKKSAKGKMSLRRTQWRLAEKNTTMAIWLGKQYLNQKDNFADEISFTDVNKGILNLAELINNPQPERREEDIE